MAISYLIDRDNRVVFTRISDMLDWPTLRRYLKTLGEDPQFDPRFRALVDMTEMTGTSVEAAEVRLAAHDQPYHKDSRRAFVVTNDLVYGMLRMYAVYSESLLFEVSIFRDLQSALDWLPLDRTLYQPAERRQAGTWRSVTVRSHDPVA